MKGQRANAHGIQKRVFLLYFSHRTHTASVHVYVGLCVRTYVCVCVCVLELGMQEEKRGEWKK